MGCPMVASISRQVAEIMTYADAARIRASVDAPTLRPAEAVRFRVDVRITESDHF